MKKLVLSVCMLLVAAALLSTSTFAWFSMNTKVTANGMQVSAKTDNAYLIIKKGTTLSGNAKEADANLNVALRPVKPTIGLTSTNIETNGTWGTADSLYPTDANSEAELTALTTETLLGDGNYVAKASFMVGIVANSGDVANDLRLERVDITDTEGGVTVVVVCGTHVYSFSDDFTEAVGAIKTLAAASAVTTAGVEVDVYIYIDGSNTAVTSANATNLGGSVTLKFTIDAVPAAA